MRSSFAVTDASPHMPRTKWRWPQSLHETGNPMPPSRRRARAQEPDGRQPTRLLSARRKRPRWRSAASSAMNSRLLTRSPHADRLRAHQSPVQLSSLGSCFINRDVHGEAMRDASERKVRLLVLTPIAKPASERKVRLLVLTPIAKPMNRFVVCCVTRGHDQGRNGRVVQIGPEGLAA
jgi:hypothetical protein